MKSQKTSRYRFLFLVAGILLFCYVINSWGYDLWDPDEPRYGIVVQEMVQDGHWMIPHLNGETYYQKPPLLYWMAAGVSLIRGNVTVFTVRLPSILFAIGLLLMLGIYASRELDENVGWLSALILGTTPMYAWLAMRMNLDMALTFFTTMAGLFLYDLLRAPPDLYRDRSTGRNEYWKGYAAFAAMALGTLVKAPIALLPLPALVVFAFWQGWSSRLKRIPWFSGFLTYFGVIGLWLGPAVYVGGYDYFQKTVLDQIVGYSSGEMGHPRPFYYYLINFPPQSLPWFLFFVPAVPLCWNFRNRKPFLRLCLTWFFFVFFVLSLVGSKRGLYLLQAYPAFAVITAWLVGKYWKNREASPDWNTMIAGASISVLFAGAGTVLYIYGPDIVRQELDRTRYYASFDRSLTLLSLVFCGGGLAILTSIFSKNGRYILYSTAGMMIGFLLVAKLWAFPALDQVKSSRPLAEAIETHRTNNEPVGVWGSRSRGTGFTFYLEENVDILPTKEQFLTYIQQKNPVLVISENDRMKRLKDPRKKLIRILLKKKTGGDIKILLTNRNASK